MSIYLTSQISSIHIQGFLNRTTADYQRVQEQLSSGDKFVSISDCPLGVTKSRVLEVQISGNALAMSNAEMGKNLLTVAEDTQDEVTTSLQRIRDLCVQGANETYTAEDKDAILAEIKQRLSDLNAIADNTEFNDIKLFNGSVSSLKLQTGITPKNTLDIGSAFTKLYASALGGDIRLGAGVTGNTWTTDDIHNYMSKVDSAINTLSHNISVSGAFTNRLSMTVNNVSVMNENLTQANSSIMDTDVAKASTVLLQKQILQQSAVSILYQASQISEIALSLLGSS